MYSLSFGYRDWDNFVEKYDCIHTYTYPAEALPRITEKGHTMIAFYPSMKRYVCKSGMQYLK